MEFVYSDLKKTEKNGTYVDKAQTTQTPKLPEVNPII